MARRKRKNKKRYIKLKIFVALLCIVFGAIAYSADIPVRDYTDRIFAVVSEYTGNSKTESVSLEDIPEYSGEPYVVIDDNIPQFSDENMTTDTFEKYSNLDLLGRCGEAYANLSPDTMPTEERGDISNVYPSGWENKGYDFIDNGGYVYNRCHLIGFQLAGENDNEKNLITGTRYMNVEGMLPFEDMVAEYIYETGNHVLFRVTPIYDGVSLVASGVQMEAKSVEDNGKGIEFNVYCYNVQPGVVIDYSTGRTHAEK